MPEKHASLAKLTRPRLVAVAERERLFGLLDERLAYPAAWVTGPPGAGKTTLISGYARSRKRPTLWYQIDGSDADVATFFHYLGVAAQEFSSGHRTGPLPALTPEYLPDLPGFTRRFFRRLFARLPRGSLVAFDDYHEVPPDSLLHGVIACAIADLPDGINCIIASRAEPPAACARLVANQAIVSLGFHELRLTDEETTAVARVRRVTNESVIETARQRSDGWVAGLILLLGTPLVASGVTAPVLSPSPESLFNYFAGIFSGNFSAETREVLLSTAFLTRVTGRLAARLSGNEQAERVLHELHEKNYFVARRPSSEAAYQFHALFREFLLEFVSQRCTPLERLAKMRRSAEALAECGEDEEAAALFGKAGDWGRASGLVLASAARLLMQGRWQTLQSRIAAFPPSVLESTPWLQFWLGASRMAVDPIAARTTLSGAYEAFTRSRDVIGQMLAAATVIEIQFILWADFTLLDRWIDALECVLAKEVAFPDAGTEMRVLTALVQALNFRAPWHPQLPGYAQRLLALLESDAAPSQRLMAAVTLGHRFAWLGHAENSSRACAIVKPLLIREDILPVHKIWALMSLGYASYTRADHAEADALFARASAIAEELGLSYIVFWMQAADCWHRLDRREYKAVSSILVKLESALAAGRGMDVAHFHLVKGWLALTEGRFASARQEIELAHALAAQNGATYTESYHVLMMAEVLIELREYVPANEWLSRFRARFGGMDSPVFEYNASLVDAYGALGQGDDARCAGALRRALQLGRANGYVTTLNWYARMMSRLCAFALEHDIETEYVKMLIARRQLLPEQPLESWPWPVRIHVLGPFEIQTNGEALHFEGKAQHKPIELAKVLIALGGRDVPADKLIDILWPGPSEGDGRKAFDITVHRLRKLLGCEDAVQVTDRRATLNAHVVWVDVWALERILAPLIPAVNAAEPEIGLLEAAAPQVLALYRGHFLEGEIEESWQIPTRNRLAGRFQRFVLRVGQHWESRQQWQRACELYERGIELDTLQESFYRRQMICLEAQGQRAEAIDVFRRCRQALSVTLGVAPTAETQAVYRQLLAP